ncbi:lysylphosphatidylglycerol synthase domain-containing protein [Azohydromonas aeria]|uniref:lysylphosphatidylglycerol synthase domain-containing protein n=1 Tax=Azohydromonas aeria TaxID=2590212 RepID=UPI0012F70A1B|nr:lysylphosphatidylglycerol synthase domain-containing protein [Azohydromonas aeria]
MLSDAPPVPTSPFWAAFTAAWPRIRRWAVPIFGLVVLGLLLSRAHQIDWAGAWAALKRYPLQLLLAAWALATLSHAVYGCFDLIGRGHVRHRVARWRSWAIAVASYAFNLNLGSLVGGVALRARLYAKAGLDETTVAQVVGISLATNWLGYGLLAGALFAAGEIALPAQAGLPPWTLRAVGVLMLGLAASYVLACAKWRGREWHLRGRCLRWPSPGRAIAQLLFSAVNWALMGAVMYLLLGERLPYAQTLAVLMAASIVGVVTPIPAGLGVLEAVYLGLLSGRLGQGTVLGAVLAYRALYYLLPLLGGIALYLLLERYAAAHPAPQPAAGTAGAVQAAKARSS